jgi:hypothetical protein
MFGWLILAIVIFIMTVLMFVGKWFDTPFIDDAMETIYNKINILLLFGSLIAINIIIFII